MTEIEIPESVTSIGVSAFSGCNSLREIEIPESVTSIGASAFSGCGSLTDIKIPIGVTVIKKDVFGACDSLTEIEIPESVTSIDITAFSGCDSLTDINVSEGNMDYASEDGVLYDKEKTTVLYCPEGKKDSFIIPAGVTSIGINSFSQCDSLTEIEIPESVTSIGDQAFFGCDSLKDIYYGGSREQWNEIDFGAGYNDITATIHYNSTLPPDLKPGETPQDPELQKPDVPIAQQKSQSITANDMTKTYGAKPFSLGASAFGGASLSYSSSNVKVASVALNGTVTITGCGVAQITVTAAETKEYKAASKTITLTVKPKKMTLSSVKSKKEKAVLVKWKQDKKASGYLIECATNQEFTKNKVKMTVGKNKTVSATVKKLKPGKKYYVRVCAYAKSGKTKIQGDWSKAKMVKVKK